MRKGIVFLILFNFFSVYSQEPEEKDLVKFQEYFFSAMNERLKGDFKKSNNNFEKCLRLQPENDVLFFKIAQNYHQLKEENKALKYIEKARKINPENKWYEKEYIEIGMSIRPYKESVRLIRDFEKRAKNKYVIRRLYRTLFDVSPQKKILQQKKEMRTEKSKRPELNRLMQQQKYEEAARLGEQILEHHPDDAQTYYLTALAYKNLKKYNNALDFLDMGMDFVLKDRNLRKSYYSLYIELYHLQGKLNKEKKYRQKLKQL